MRYGLGTGIAVNEAGEVVNVNSVVKVEFEEPEDPQKITMRIGVLL